MSSEEIKEKFDERINRWLEIDKKEIKLRNTLICTILTLALLFSSYNLYYSVKKYKDYVKNSNSINEEIVSVKIEEVIS